MHNREKYDIYSIKHRIRLKKEKDVTPSLKLHIALQHGDNNGIPLNYTYPLQNAVIGLLPARLNKLVHDEGIYSRLSPSKIFKPYNLSRLSPEKMHIENKFIFSDGDIHLYISSHNPDLINEFGSAFLKKGILNISKAILTVKTVELIDLEIDEEQYFVKTVSPIVVMDTLRQNNKNKTVFYHPSNSKYSTKIAKNLKEKYSAITSDVDVSDEKIKKMGFRIAPLKVKKEIVQYKNISLTAYSGLFAITGNKELIKVAYNLGLGNRSAYCGCILI